MFAVLLLACLGIGLGFWEARDCASLRFAYIADYSYAGVLSLSIGLSVIGLLLLIYWRTRWVGAGLIAAGILSCAMFYTGMTVLVKEDRVAWRHEPPLERFGGPGAKASAVIYFRRGVTREQVEEFDSLVLQGPAPPWHDGRDYPPFLATYVSLLPSQANGHEAIALTFFNDAPPDKVNAYLATIKADSRVARVFLDTAPDAIHPAPKGP